MKVELRSHHHRVQCPCCGYYTLDRRGGFELCPVCLWQDEEYREQFGKFAPERPHGPNRVHLWQARRNFIDFGASEKRRRPRVRPPHDIERPDTYDGPPVAIDESARSTQKGVPAFIARPEGAPVYYGFPVLDDVEVDGFRLGMISDFEREASTWGDAFVVAPDYSRGGLIWVTEGDDQWLSGGFDEVMRRDYRRWGVWQVALPYRMRTRDDARRNLESIVPMLRMVWEEWRDTIGKDIVLR